MTPEKELTKTVDEECVYAVEHVSHLRDYYLNSAMSEVAGKGALNASAVQNASEAADLSEVKRTSEAQDALDTLNSLNDLLRALEMTVAEMAEMCCEGEDGLS